MTELPTAIVRRGAHAALRLLTIGGLAAMLGGCYDTHMAQQPEYPNDYRLRHPITLKESDRTVEVFVGRNRGGLTPIQRADVLAFAQLWRREATSGIIVDIPQGGAVDHAAADSMREIHSIFAASGVPQNAVYVRNYRPATSRARQHQDQLYENGGAGRSLRSVAGKRRPRPGFVPTSRTGRTGISAAPVSATSPAMVDNPADLVQSARRIAVLHPASLDGDRQVPQGRQSLRHIHRLRHRQDQRSREMIKHAQQVALAQDEPMAAAVADNAADEHIAPAPRVSVCRPSASRWKPPPAVQAAGEDRRLAKAHVKIQMGGATAAVEAYRGSPTPNVIFIEAEQRGEDILTKPRPACRGLRRRHARGGGRPHQRRHALSRTDAARRQRLFDRADRHHRRGALDLRAVHGARRQGGRPHHRRWSAPKAASAPPPSRTNVAWAIARDLALDAVVTDLDLAFGTAGLDTIRIPPQGIADAVFSPDRIDTAFVDRLLSKCTDTSACWPRRRHWSASTISAPRLSTRSSISLRSSIPCVVLDVPHQWSGWTKRLLVSADDILVVAGPDLANLRNAKNWSICCAPRGRRSSPLLLPQPGRRAEASGNHAGRFRQGAGRPAAGGDPVRTAAFRHGRQ